MPILAQIAAYPGAGKTYMARALMEEYKGSALLIRDTDDMLVQAGSAAGNNREKFRKLFLKKMRDFAKKNSSKFIVFVGTFGYDPVWQAGYYPVLDDTTLLWMNVSIKVAVEQSITRFLTEKMKDPVKWIKTLRKLGSEKIHEHFDDQLNPITREEIWKDLKPVFLKKGFIPKSREDIIIFIIQLLEHAHDAQIVLTGSKRRKL